MTLKLTPHWIEHLANLPETGQGYQEARINFGDGYICYGIAYGDRIEIADAIREFTCEEINTIEVKTWVGRWHA